MIGAPTFLATPPSRYRAGIRLAGGFTVQRVEQRRVDRVAQIAVLARVDAGLRRLFAVAGGGGGEAR